MASSTTFRLQWADGRQLALWVNNLGELTYAITYEATPGTGDEEVLDHGHAELEETPVQVRQLAEWAAHLASKTGGA